MCVVKLSWRPWLKIIKLFNFLKKNKSWISFFLPPSVIWQTLGSFLQSCWLRNEKLRAMLKMRLNKVLASSGKSSLPWPCLMLWTASLTLFWPGPTRVAGCRSPCSSARQVLDFLAFVTREVKSSFIFQVCYFRIYGTSDSEQLQLLRCRNGSW